MPPVHMRGDGRMAKDPKKTLLRLLTYMKHYIPNLVAVLICIIVSAIAVLRLSSSSSSLGLRPEAKYFIYISGRLKLNQRLP